VTGGPTGPGKVHDLKTVIAGTDSLAVDSFAVTLAPWNNRSLDCQVGAAPFPCFYSRRWEDRSDKNEHSKRNI